MTLDKNKEQKPYLKSKLGPAVNDQVEIDEWSRSPKIEQV